LNARRTHGANEGGQQNQREHHRQILDDHPTHSDAAVGFVDGITIFERA
jgi:hypothetical protein